ncbi:DUF4328 domain-containing protein [Kitasatospora sp. NPDC089509]|uniref:DUF4328 domain-containing protein n=1 Tax=Kitasatospora sp. NPDC089509 TaxID=3364079 RepID=UPI00380229B1
MSTEADRVEPRPRVLRWPAGDPRSLAVAAQVLIAAQTALQVVLAAAGGIRTELFRQCAPLNAPLFIGAVVVFLCWFRRCRLNAERFAPRTHKYSTGFAVGAWFIPGAMWWIPRQVALDIWRASPSAGGAWLIDAWWVAFLAKTVGGVVLELTLPFQYLYSPYDAAVAVVAAVLAVLVIRGTTAGQYAAASAEPAVPPFAGFSAR